VTIEHCGNLQPQTGAPGEPPRHESKSEHWRRVGEKRNPSYKNRLTVVAPVSSQSSAQRRRFGFLKESDVDSSSRRVSYEPAEAAGLPVIQQPTVFSFLHAAKTSSNGEVSKPSETSAPFGDKDLTKVLTQMQLEWLLKSSITYENVTLSAHMLRLAVGYGVGYRLNVQAVKSKYTDLLR